MVVKAAARHLYLGMNEIMPPLLLSPSLSLDPSESGSLPPSLPPSVGSGGGPFRFVTRQKICEADRLTGCLARIKTSPRLDEIGGAFIDGDRSFHDRLAFLSALKGGKFRGDISKRNYSDSSDVRRSTEKHISDEASVREFYDGGTS